MNVPDRIKIHTEIQPKKIYRGYFFICLIVMGIGFFTITSKEALLNAEAAGTGLIIAGIIGILHCFSIIKKASIATYAMEFAITYRIGAFLVSLFLYPYEPSRPGNILTWLLLLLSAFVNERYIVVAHQVRYQQKEIEGKNKPNCIDCKKDK